MTLKEHNIEATGSFETFVREQLLKQCESPL